MNKPNLILQAVEQIYTTSHTALYNLIYRNKDDKIKKYNIVSRNKNLTFERLSNPQPPVSNGVVICAITEDHQKMLILDEFRMSINQNIINCPSGLIDPGETIEEAARRELLEESGHQLLDVITICPPAYSAIGITDEAISTIICYISEKPENHANTSPNEDLRAKLIDRDTMRSLLTKRAFSSRTQLLALNWLNELF